MFFWIIKNIVLSLIFIFISHSLYEYFKQMYSTPKLKDLVVRPQEDYKEMYKHIHGETVSKPVISHKPNPMKEYLKQLKQNTQQQPELSEYSTSNLPSSTF